MSWNLGIFEPSLAVWKGIRCNSAHKDSVVQHNESTKKLCQQQQVESSHMLSLIWWVIKHFSLGSFQHFLLVVLLPHMNDTLSISMYKELQNHQLLSTSSLFSYKWWYETSANNVLYKLLWKLDTLPPFFYYEFLISVI